MGSMYRIHRRRQPNPRKLGRGRRGSILTCEERRRQGHHGRRRVVGAGKVAAGAEGILSANQDGHVPATCRSKRAGMALEKLSGGTNTLDTKHPRRQGRVLTRG